MESVNQKPQQQEEQPAAESIQEENSQASEDQPQEENEAVDTEQTQETENVPSLCVNQEPQQQEEQPAVESIRHENAQASEDQPQEEINAVDTEQSQETKNVNRLFVGGVDSSITQEDLQEYFSKYGEVKEFTFKENEWKNGKSNRFAFVGYAHRDSYEKVLQVTVHEVKGIKINIKVIRPQKTYHKIRIGNIGSLTENDIKNHFSQYGNLGCLEKPPGKDYCLLSFVTKEALEEACKEGTQTIGSTQVAVSKALPHRHTSQNRGRGAQGTRGSHRYAPYGAPAQQDYYPPSYDPYNPPYDPYNPPYDPFNPYYDPYNPPYDPVNPYYDPYDPSYDPYNSYPYVTYEHQPSNYGRARGGRRGAGRRGARRH